MSKVGLLNLLIDIENILCIHRNYCSLKKHLKILVAARVILGIFLNLAISVAFIMQIIYSTDDLFIAAKNILFLVLSTMNSLVPIILGISRAFSFKILIESVNSVHKYCTGDVTYDKKLNTLRKVVLGVCAFCVCYAICYLYYFFVTRQWLSEDKYESDASFVIKSFWVVWKYLRFYFEILTINVLLRIIIISLARLETKLFRLSVTLDESIDGIDDLTYYHQFQKELDQWFSAYNNLKLCRDGIAQRFGVQIVFLLFLLTYGFISLGYEMVAVLISKEAGINAFHFILLINFTIAMIVLLYTCQDAQNEGELLKRLMIKLYGKILTIQGPHVLKLKRLVKHYHRQMAVQPIILQVMSTTNLQMSLLLAILSTGISYIIVLLQFRHVV